MAHTPEPKKTCPFSLRIVRKEERYKAIYPGELADHRKSLPDQPPFEYLIVYGHFSTVKGFYLTITDFLEKTATQDMTLKEIADLIDKAEFSEICVGAIRNELPDIYYHTIGKITLTG